MKFQSRWLRRLAGFSVATFASNWMATMSYKGALYEEGVDPARENFRGPAIFLFWHEYLLAPFYLRGHCNMAVLSSTHRDAEWIVEAASFMGFKSVRGSTTRQAAKALRELARALETTNVAITPDGPRGPRRTMSQGPIFLASKLGVPLVLCGFGYDRPWRMNTWDNFALPRPGSRSRGVMSPLIQIPPDLDRDGIEHYRRRMEELLNRVTAESEAWAEAETSKVGEIRAGRQPSPVKLRELSPEGNKLELSERKVVLPKAA
jgi:lysophospholipid acyltransferase (LPLAT)-like uncharacterized protein